MRARVLLSAACLLAACRQAPVVSGSASPDGARPLTRAERSSFTETSTHADVAAFLDTLARLAPVHVATLGNTSEQRAIPLFVASRPLVRTAAEARALGRPVVFVQGGIHGGEIEGKEALLALVRDLLRDARPNVLDSLVLVGVPMYNADGGERLGPQERNRTEQQGPAMVGERANAQGLDLNRDYVKAEAPETRAALAFMREWDPDVFVDLHTTNGSYHGYALTYAPSLSPAALYTGPFTRDSLLPELRRRMKSRHGTEVFDYGNFVSHDSVARGWFTYDSRPRFGTNYYALRGRIAILSEAYSHDPFARRVDATYDFTREILSLVAERGASIRELVRDADRRTVDAGSGMAPPPLVSLRATYPRDPPLGDVLVEAVVRTGDSSRTEAGMPRGLRRIGAVRVARIPVYDRFVSLLARPLASAYAFPPEALDSLAPRLALHGIVVERLEAPAAAVVERFAVDSVTRASRPFQGHRELRAHGRWGTAERTDLPAGWGVVRTAQPLGILAAYLLEPESDDGLATWNALDAFIRQGATHPVLRVVQPLAARGRVLR